MTILHGDCRELLRQMPDASIDSIVTDPPYELGFMGKQWDASGVAYDVTLWRECLRVLKPGGHLLAFGGTRTYHRMAVAIEDAGFEVRDSIHWLYGSGFPKSLDVSKAIDKAAGAEREVLGVQEWQGRSAGILGTPVAIVRDITAPATDAARQWDGWGTALKPAHEPIVLARKPLDGTVAATVLEHGTGALNIDGCRVGFQSEADERESKDKNRHADFGTEPGGNNVYGDYSMVARTNYDPTGRWPANIVLTHAADCGDDCAPGCPVQMLDAQSGVSVSSDRPRNNTAEAHNRTTSMGRATADWTSAGHNDTGGASRFFTVTEWGELDVPFRYIAKPSKRERNAGLEGLPERSTAGEYRPNDDGTNGLSSRRHGATTPRQNHHPTVKPVALMRWLVRLITPPGGTVLDPFLGSGTTAVAATLEGFDWVGCEMTAEYLPIIEGRVAHARDYSPALAAKVAAVGDEVVRQLDLFGGEAA